MFISRAYIFLYRVFQLLRNAEHRSALANVQGNNSRKLARFYQLVRSVSIQYTRALFGKYKLNLINEQRDEGRHAFWSTANGCISIVVSEFRDHTCLLIHVDTLNTSLLLATVPTKATGDNDGSIVIPVRVDYRTLFKEAYAI